MIMSLLVLRVLYVVFNLPAENLSSDDDNDHEYDEFVPEQPPQPGSAKVPETVSV